MVTLVERLERRAERGSRRDPDEVLAEVRRDLDEGDGRIRAGRVGGADEGVVYLSSGNARRLSAGRPLVAAAAVVALVVGVVAWRLTTDGAEESPVATESSATTVPIAEPDGEDVPQLAVDGWLWPATPTATSAEEARDDFLRDVLGVDPASVTAKDLGFSTGPSDPGRVGHRLTLPSGGDFTVDLAEVEPGMWAVSSLYEDVTVAWTDGDAAMLGFVPQPLERTGRLLVAGADGVTRQVDVDENALQGSVVELDAWPLATLLVVRDSEGALVDVMGGRHGVPSGRDVTGLAPLLDELPSEPLSVVVEVGAGTLTLLVEPGRIGVDLQHPSMVGRVSVSGFPYDARPLVAGAHGEEQPTFRFGAVGWNAAHVEVEDSRGRIFSARTVEVPGLDGPRLFLLELPAAFSWWNAELRFLSETSEVLYRERQP